MRESEAVTNTKLDINYIVNISNDLVAGFLCLKEVPYLANTRTHRHTRKHSRA